MSFRPSSSMSSHNKQQQLQQTTPSTTATTAQRTTTTTQEYAEHMSQISNCLHSILRSKYYSLIESQCHQKWTQQLRQSLAKQDIRVEIDFESFTHQLFLKQYLNVGDLLPAILQNRLLQQQQRQRSESLTERSPVKRKNLKQTLLSVRKAGVRLSSSPSTPSQIHLLLNNLNLNKNNNNNKQCDDNSLDSKTKKKIAIEHKNKLKNGGEVGDDIFDMDMDGDETEEQTDKSNNSNNDPPLFVDQNCAKHRDELEMIVMRDQANGIRAIEVILKELPLIVESMIEEHLIQTVIKYDVYKRYLYHHLNCMVFRYGDQENGKQVGHLSEDGTQMIHYLDVVFKSNSKLHWLKRPCGFMGQVHGNHLKFMHYDIGHHLIPDLSNCIKSVMRSNVSVQVDWDSITQQSNEKDILTCYRTLYHSQSALVIQRISRAFDHLSSVENDDLLDAISSSVHKIIIRQSSRRHHMFNADSRTIILHLVLHKPPMSCFDPLKSLYEVDDYSAIIKYCGLYSGNRFPVELQSSAACLPCLVDNISLPLRDIIQRQLLWMPNVDERKAFKSCQQFIDKKLLMEKAPTQEFKRRTSLFSFNKSDSIPASQSASAMNTTGKPSVEQPLCAWHVVKFNLNNMAQERILFLTTHAYYVFRYDFANAKLDEGHFKRHDLCDINCLEIGDDVVNIYTLESRRRSIFFKFTGRDSDCSSPVNNGMEDCTDDYIENHPRIRVHKEATDEKQPNRDGLYSNVFMFIDPAKSKLVVKEIAWMIYGACVLRKGEKCTKPFTNPELTKPKTTLGSLFYNKLGMGITSNLDDYWSEYRNPLYNKTTAFKEVRIKAVENNCLAQMGETASTDELSTLDVEDGETTESDTCDLQSLDDEEKNNRIMQRYQVEQQIDSGNEGRIYLAINNRSNKKVAIKAMPYMDEHQAKIDYELSLVKLIQHNNIVKLYETFVLTSDTLIGQEKNMYMVMEYSETNLENVIKMMSERGSCSLDQKLVCSWLLQIATGLGHMHAQGIMHRDIKTQNILLNTHDPRTDKEMSPGKWKVKVCDFGLSTRIKDEQDTSSNVLYGTPLYMAPEIATFKNHDASADVWSFGVIVVQLLMLKPAEQMPNVFEGLSKRSGFVSNMLKSTSYHSSLLNLAIECCSLNPQVRPSMEQVVAVLSSV